MTKVNKIQLNDIQLEELLQILSMFNRDFMILVKEEGNVEGFIAISNQRFSAYYRGLRGEFALDKILDAQNRLEIEVRSGVSRMLNCRIPITGYLIERVARNGY